MDQKAYSKVKTGKVEQPAIRVPCPACDGTVNNGSPAESEDHGRHDATTLKGSTDNELDGAGAEEHLVEAEDDLREQSGTGRRGSHYVLQSEVLHVADERTGGTRVGKRITPEEPLEADTEALLVQC